MIDEFESAFAAFRNNDANPMRQYLGLPLRGDCEDCGKEEILQPHGNSLICLACHCEREAFLSEVHGCAND